MDARSMTIMHTKTRETMFSKPLVARRNIGVFGRRYGVHWCLHCASCFNKTCSVDSRKRTCMLLTCLHAGTRNNNTPVDCMNPAHVFLFEQKPWERPIRPSRQHSAPLSSDLRNCAKIKHVSIVFILFPDHTGTKNNQQNAQTSDWRLHGTPPKVFLGYGCDRARLSAWVQFSSFYYPVGQHQFWNRESSAWFLLCPL